MFFEEKAFNPFMGGGARGTAIDEFNGDNFDHAGLGFFGGAYIDVASSGRDADTLASRCPRARRNGARNGSAPRRTTTSATSASGCTARCQSYRQNYLDLDPTYRDANGLPLLRMTFDWGDNERKCIGLDHEEGRGDREGDGPFADERSRRQPATTTSCPTRARTTSAARSMGADPATSAVNKYLQSWDVSNVFVIGGSAFPQNSAYPPTGTIGTLACWAADNIKDTYLKRPGPMAVRTGPGTRGRCLTGQWRTGKNGFKSLPVHSKSEGAGSVSVGSRPATSTDLRFTAESALRA